MDTNHNAFHKKSNLGRSFYGRMSFLMTTILMTILSCSEKSFSRIEHLEIDSNFLGKRSIDVWLPSGYAGADKRYPVLYMHDGQMLFDLTTTWNGKEWGVDEVMNRLVTTGKTKEAIVVGIWNGGEKRHSEYFPQKPFTSLPEYVQDSIMSLERYPSVSLFSGDINSDNYLKFITQELKPMIDTEYKTLSDRSNTFIGGSSMGGLISWYAICEYPDIFGAAICMSSHWIGTFTTERNPIPKAFFSYLDEYLPNPKNHKIYMDHGTETLDSLYGSYQIKVDSIFAKNGFDENNYMSVKYPGHAHDEIAWSNRLHVPLSFILTKDQ